MGNKSYFYYITNQKSMNTEKTIDFSSLTERDLEIIYCALEYKVRGTEKFLHETLEPSKGEYPELFKSYARELAEERSTCSTFHKLLMEVKTELYYTN
jgi:hypothetical protein